MSKDQDTQIALLDAIASDMTDYINKRPETITVVEWATIRDALRRSLGTHWIIVDAPRKYATHVPGSADLLHEPKP